MLFHASSFSGCTGLPKLDRWSNTDAVCYAVCGPYAFVSDVIREKNHPIWPRRARRACAFPLHHAFCTVCIGVFDDDGVHQDDDFAGRVELDISRLRPGCTYDVTLPLRLSTDVYTRQPGRGTIRLRFRLIWDSEQSAVLSYLPRRDTLVTAIKYRKEDRVPPPTVTLRCADAKSFRNVAITIHGTHMPSRYTQKGKAKMLVLSLLFLSTFTRVLFEPIYLLFLRTYSSLLCSFSGHCSGI